MKSSVHFPTAVVVSNTLMGGVYLATCIIVVAFQGRDVAEFLPDSIPESHSTTRLVVGVLVAYHVLISYILMNQPLSNALHAMVSPSTLLDRSKKGRLVWFGITFTLLLFSFWVANAIPFFSAFQALVGSLLGAPLMFGCPAFFYVGAHLDQGRPMPWWDWALCGLFLCVFLPLCTIAGSISAFESLLSNWSSSGGIFQC